MKSVKIGFAPTRRSIFRAPDAVKYANLTRERLKELGVEFVDITDINEEGLFYDEADREKIQEKFRRENVKGIFFPHGNFGTEYVCARLAKEMGLPVLLWGPRDERPDENGVRLRDSQCGLFATGKVLRRFGVPFTYMTNCRLTDPEFERGIQDFLAVCNVVDTFRHTRILQIGPRPFDFWSTMCNEGELLEKFNIQLSPIPLPELTAEMKKSKSRGQRGGKSRCLLQHQYVCKDQTGRTGKCSSSEGCNEEPGCKIFLQCHCDPVLERTAGRDRHYAVCGKLPAERRGNSGCL